MASLNKIQSLIQKASHESQKLVLNINLFVKIIWFFMLAGYCLSFEKNLFYNSVIIPGEFFPPNFKIWTLITHVFVEVHLWSFFVNLVVVFLYHQLLQPLWGLVELYRFLCINTIIPALLTASLYTTHFLIEEKPDSLFNSFIYGFSAPVAGFCVAVKQIMPEKMLLNLKLFKLQNRHMPLLLLFIYFMASLLCLVTHIFPILFLFGVLSSWFYLRFFQRHNNGIRGDGADSFCFASFFPNILQQPISFLINSLFSLLVTIGCCHDKTKYKQTNLISLETRPSNEKSISISLKSKQINNLNNSQQKVGQQQQKVSSKPRKINQSISTGQLEINQPYQQPINSQQDTSVTMESDETLKAHLKIKEALSKNLITFTVVNSNQQT